MDLASPAVSGTSVYANGLNVKHFTEFAEIFTDVKVTVFVIILVSFDFFSFIIYIFFLYIGTYDIGHTSFVWSVTM